MIPYLTPEDFPELPISIFATLVLTGMFLGICLILWRFRNSKLSFWEVIEMCLWTLVPAYLGGHMLDVIVYYPEKFVNEPMLLFQFGNGLSAFGGLIFGAISFYMYLRITGNISAWKERGDILIQGFIVGWIFGRIGCSIVHDHPGIASNFFLAMQYPGGARHDLGFYELLHTLFFLVPAFLWIHHKNMRPGTQLVAFCVSYALFRWPADFLRTADIHYFGWTPGQYASILMLIVAYIIFRKMEQEKTLGAQ